MGRFISCIVAGLVAASVGTAHAAVPPPSSGGAYTVRIGADSTTASTGENWEGIGRSAGRLRSGNNGFGAFYVTGDVTVDPEFGDRQGWRLTIPAGVRLSTFSVDASTGSWVAGRWTSGLRYTLSATDAAGNALAPPFLSCEPTPTSNDCPDAFESSAQTPFTAPAGTRRIEFAVECVQAQGCSRFANPDGGPGGNEYAAVEGATLHLVDDTAPALTTGSGELWTDDSRWFHNGDTAVAAMGAIDNSGVSGLRWYVDGSLAFDTSGATSVFRLPCDYSRFKPCSATSAVFPIASSLFTIPDGTHELAVVAVDAAGNVSPSLARGFRLDDTAPPRVRVNSREGSALRDPGPWHLDFTVPPELEGAPLERAWYRFCAASNANDCTPATPVRDGVDGLAPGSSATVAVSPPSPGEWNVHVWLEDRAGNGTEANASDPVLIRYGQSAPVADLDHPPTLSGDFTDGQRVHVSATGFQVAGAVSYAFQWQRCSRPDGGGCVDVVGAVGQDYVLMHADAGQRMRARVTAANAKGSDSALSAVSDPVGLLPPSDGSAVLAGAMRAGEELRVVDPRFDGTPPFELSYRWLRCSSGACDAIAGADRESYVLGDEDVGQTVRAFVTASNAAGSHSAEASRVGEGGVVLPAPPRSLAAPRAPAGSLQVGKLLTADDGVWAGSRPMTFSYVWQRCTGSAGGCSAIEGATAGTYALVGEDVGKVIRVLVTARNGGESVGPVASGRTSAIVAAPVEAAAPVGPADPVGPVVPVAPPPPIPPPAAPVAAPAPDLSKIPGNLVGTATCKVVRATPKKRAARLRGVGAVTFVAAIPARVTAAAPLLLTLKAPRGKVRSVTYRAGRRAVGRSRRAPYRVAVKPKGLEVGGTQALTASVAPRRTGVKPGLVAMRLNVAPCPSLLTAGIAFSGAGAITQLRVFARTSIRSGTLVVPAKLVPRQRVGKRAGTLTLTGVDGRPVARPVVAGRGGRLTTRGGPAVALRRSGRKVVFGGVPAGTGIVQLDLFGPRAAALKLLRGTKTLRFTANVRAAGIPAQRLVATVKPTPRRRR